jgi:hypothetical protein
MDADLVQLVTVARDTILAGVAVFTSVVAWRGLSKWQDEQRGKADFEVARSILKATFQVREALRFARRPYVMAAEFPASYAGRTQRGSAEEVAAWEHVFNSRWSEVRTAAIELQTCSVEAEVLWGASVQTLTRKLLQCVQEFQTALSAHLANEQAGGAHFAKDAAFGKRVNAQVFSTTAEVNDADNAFSILIDSAVQSIEDAMRKHLRRY